MGEMCTGAKSGDPSQPWQLALKNTKERLQHLYTSILHTDLDIILPEYNESLKVHRIVLAMSSPVFESMLMGPLAVRNELKLYGDSSQAIHKLLDHMYMDDMDLESVELALEVYAAAHKYQLEAAMNCCSQYIVSNMTPDITLAALEASVLFEDEDIKSKCNEMLHDSPDDVMSAKCVNFLKKETLKNLLQEQNLTVTSEVVLLNAVIDWGKAQLQRRGEEYSGSALREEIEDLLKEVRFLTISCEEFIDKVIDTEVLSHTECINILKAIRGANCPDSFNTSKVRRGPRLEDLPKASLQTDSVYLRKKIYRASDNFVFVGTVESDKNIYIYHMEANREGTINIVNCAGDVLGSATSQNNVFTFRQPVALKRGMPYDIKFAFKSKTVLSSNSEEETVFDITVEDVTITYEKDCDIDLQLYFSKQ
ncbi:BTB/POZ domain-containing protein 6-like isoform X1 [Oratosquilla oratoria]|uniref:BTB/POZ domain-containing protein 6-like isoform X1 n=1 Tax=Oratosquilla oratoria TaxID=337810 RepID=UPI003F76724A